MVNFISVPLPHKYGTCATATAPVLNSRTTNLPSMDFTNLPPTEPFEQLRSKSCQFYLFGLHLGKSKAPLLCNTIFKQLGINWNYQIEETDQKSKFHERFASDNVIGSAVTMPNKVAFLSEVDHTDEIGTGVGAINTVYTRLSPTGEKLKIGTNTDTVGIKESFLQTEAAEIANLNNGAPGLVYGGGGASRSAVYALYKFFGCKQVYIINRDKGEINDLKASMNQSAPYIDIVHIETPEQANNCGQPKLAVLCVPNFPPSTPSEILAKETLSVFMNRSTGAVLEMCYNPVVVTELYKEFEASGWIVISGITAMIYQGLTQISLWSGYSIKELPLEEAMAAVSQ